MVRRLPDCVKAVHRAWGTGIGGFRGNYSVLEGHIAVAAEYAVHDLCHAFFLGLEPRFGRCKGLESTIGRKLGTLPEYQQELHEVRSAAAELLALQELGLRTYLDEDSLCCMFRANSALLKVRVPKEKTRDVLQGLAQRKRVQQAAAWVVAFVQQKPAPLRSAGGGHDVGVHLSNGVGVPSLPPAKPGT